MNKSRIAIPINCPITTYPQIVTGISTGSDLLEDGKWIRVSGIIEYRKNRNILLKNSVLNCFLH